MPWSGRSTNPPILSGLAGGGAAEPALPAPIAAAVRLVQANDYAGALAELDAVPQAARDARYWTYRAGVLLNVGRAEEASAAIERALAPVPDASGPLAQRAIIELAQNRTADALADARRAVELSPDSAPALIAMSYALQGNFDLEEARRVLREAVERVPDDPLLWARLAELELSFGDLDAAEEAAERAVALAPDLVRTQMVLEFAHLTRIDIEEAKAAFERAMALDSANPLSRLGLGLAKIRESDLENGRREIESAAGLDTNSSLIRSYLGKAYFEERRDSLAADQFRIAKQLDPNDPTPWLYDAIRLQTTNRPVEALRQLEKSIALNDNRAVFRSRLLLDEDLATRETSLARIYNDLGFEQRALVEGWRSVNRDPTNYSAHRLLVDTYSALPLHEIARDSELLQAQLLQPLNTEPVQPRLAESQLGLLRDVGLTGIGLNEYTRLFVANGADLFANGVVGTQDTFADDLIASGIYNNYSLNVGQSHFATDGFRQNNDVDENIYHVFGQTQVRPSTSIMAESRSRHADSGDLSLRFWPDNFFPGLRLSVPEKVLRIGWRHSFAPHSTLIGSYAFNQAKPKLRLPGVEFIREDQGHFLELSQLFRWNGVSMTGGIGYFDGEEDEEDTFGMETSRSTSELTHRKCIFVQSTKSYR